MYLIGAVGGVPTDAYLTRLNVKRYFYKAVEVVVQVRHLLAVGIDCEGLDYGICHTHGIEILARANGGGE